MDKELLALLISALTEMEVVELYKVKKVNNFGFRVNTIEDVRRNRKILEENLLKPGNLKRVQDYFIFKSSILEINLDGLELNELKELCENKGHTNVLITLYVKDNKDDFMEIISCFLKETNEESLDNNNNVQIEEGVLENRLNKKIKKLEIKLNTVNDEFKKRENYYKLELDKTNKLLIELRKDNTGLKQDLNQINKEKSQHINENLNLKNLNDMLQIQIETYINEIKELEKEVTFLNEEINLLNDKIQVSNDTISSEVNNIDMIRTNKIAVIGEFNEIISDVNGIQMEFIEGEAIKEFTIDDISHEYKEIWIIHYDLTQKEKRIVQMKNFESNLELKVRDIHSLKELNQAIINLKK